MMVTWTLGVWSDVPQDEAVVQSMLSLMQGGLTDRWCYSDAATADFVVLGQSKSHPPRTNKNDPYVVAQLTESGFNPAVDVAMQVSRPLRAMPFMDLLQEASSRLRGKAAFQLLAATGGSSVRGDVVRRLLLAGQALVELKRSNRFDPVSVLAVDGSLMAMIDRERGTVASGFSPTQLIERLGQQFGCLQIHTNHAWESSQTDWSVHPLDCLAWQLGHELGQQIGLAPWLQKTTPYRVISWPDFGVIGSNRLWFKLSAELSLRARNATQLLDDPGVDSQVVACFLNSVSLCGLLVSAPDTAPAALAARRLAPERLSMISRLRLKLGL